MTLQKILIDNGVKYISETVNSQIESSPLSIPMSNKNTKYLSLYRMLHLIIILTNFHERIKNINKNTTGEGSKIIN